VQSIALIRKIIVVLILSLSVAHAEPENISKFRQILIKYHDSGQYLKEFKQTVAKAKAYLKKRLFENKVANKPQKLAIVLDIDETSLSNYDYMVKRDFGGTKETIHKEESQGDAPVIKPMLELYNYAHKNNIAVFFVTGRRENQRNITVSNLKLAGYGGWQGLYLRPDDYQQKSIIPFKTTARRNIEAQGYEIIASLGDQNSDIKGGYTEKGYKLPNPYYYLP
jgi:predicted secreted acid phosphatase